MASSARLDESKRAKRLSKLGASGDPDRRPDNKRKGREGQEAPGKTGPVPGGSGRAKTSGESSAAGGAPVTRGGSVRRSSQRRDDPIPGVPRPGQEHFNPWFWDPANREQEEREREQRRQRRLSRKLTL